MILSVVQLREHFGSAVRSQRLHRGWTQRELAEEASITEKYLSRIENGEVDASLSISYRLANALAVGLDVLVQTKPSPKTTSPVRAEFQRLASQLDDAELARAGAVLGEILRVYGSKKVRIKSRKPVITKRT